MPITGEANIIKTIKSLLGTYNTPSLNEKDTHNTNTKIQESANNITSFLYKRGILRILFSKMILI